MWGLSDLLAPDVSWPVRLACSRCGHCEGSYYCDYYCEDCQSDILLLYEGAFLRMVVGNCERKLQYALCRCVCKRNVRETTDFPSTTVRVRARSTCCLPLPVDYSTYLLTHMPSLSLVCCSCRCQHCHRLHSKCN